MKYSFPSTYGNDERLVPIDAALIPILSNAISALLTRDNWQDSASYELGYNAIAKVLANMAGSSIADLIYSVDRVYRLLDTSLNGTEYSSIPNPTVPTRPIVLPSLPAYPPVSTGAPNAMRAHIGRLWQISENFVTGETYSADSGIDGSPALTSNTELIARLRLIQGEINEGWFGIGGNPATIADIVNALRVGSDDDTERITDAIDNILGDSGLGEASSAANIFNTIRELVTGTAEVTAEGGILATLIASSLASAALGGILAGQIDRLIKALDGGATPAPASNVLAELETIKGQLQ